MIIIRITMETLPEKQKEVVQTILSLMASMEREAGCLSYLKSDVFGVLLGTKSLLRQAHSIQIHTVRKTEGMEAVLAVRNTKGGRR